MAKIDFACDEIWRRFPGMVGSIADFELWRGRNVRIATGEPLEIVLGIIDHLLREVGAINGVAHKGGLLEHDAGAAERIEETAFWGAVGREINENLGELRWQHTDESITSRAGLIAFSVGGDVLGANRGGENVVELDEFDVVELLTELVVVSGSARDDGGFAGDEANIATMSLQEILIFESEGPGGFLAGLVGII